MSIGYPAELKRRLEEKVREERAQAKLLIGMGILFASITFLAATFGLSMILALLGVKYVVAFLVGFLLAAAVLGFDAWRHPSRHVAVERIYLEGGDPATILREGAGDSGAPSVEGEKVLQGCAGAILGGPRNIRAAVEQLRALRAKSDERVESAGVRFLAWLKEKQPVTEEEVADAIQKDPSLSKGLSLALELGIVTRRKEGPQRLIEMKE